MLDIKNATDLSPIKHKQQAAWATGDYAVVGTTLQIVGEQLCETLDLRAGMRVLDVAAGNGNATLAAARRWCDVVSTDYVGALLAAGRRRAEAEGLHVTFEEADAERLPFADASFDAVTSTFGVMFTPDQEAAARELARVCKPGGKIGLANWTPGGFIGRLFAIIGRHLPPPAGVRPPSTWGRREHVQALFGATATVTAITRTFTFRYRSAAHFIDVFRTYYGPVNRAFAAMTEDGQRAFVADLHQLLAESNRADDGTLVVPSEYLEVIVQPGPAAPLLA